MMAVCPGVGIDWFQANEGDVEVPTTHEQVAVGCSRVWGHATRSAGMRLG